MNSLTGADAPRHPLDILMGVCTLEIPSGWPLAENGQIITNVQKLSGLLLNFNHKKGNGEHCNKLILYGECWRNVNASTIKYLSIVMKLVNRISLIDKFQNKIMI